MPHEYQSRDNYRQDDMYVVQGQGPDTRKRISARKRFRLLHVEEIWDDKLALASRHADGTREHMPWFPHRIEYDEKTSVHTVPF